MRAVLVVFNLMIFASGTYAHEIKFALSNRGSTPIAALVATPKGSAREPAANILAAGVGIGETAEVAFAAPLDTCVFDLSFSLAVAGEVSRPDVDLCQTEVLIVE